MVLELKEEDTYASSIARGVLPYRDSFWKVWVSSSKEKRLRRPDLVVEGSWARWVFQREGFSPFLSH